MSFLFLCNSQNSSCDLSEFVFYIIYLVFKLANVLFYLQYFFYVIKITWISFTFWKAKLAIW